MIVLASLVFAVAFSALPSTEPSDDEEYAQYQAYMERRRAKAAKAKKAAISSDSKRKLVLENKEGINAKRSWKGGGMRGCDFGIQVPSTDSVDPLAPSPTITSASRTSRALSHSFSFPSFAPSTSPFPSSPVFEGGDKCGFRHLRRVSSVPSLSMSATSSRQGSIISSPETTTVTLH